MKNEPRYEHIDILIKSRQDGESWFDIISDYITQDCELLDDNTCSCDLESMGGTSGTLDQCYDAMRISEKWAQDVLADDLKLALHRLAADEGMDDEAYKRLKKAAFWHEEFQEWLDNLPDDDEEEEEG